MPLSAGDRLGPYEIVAPLGAGGMGEVYRAHDGKLNRDVAIKVLPEAFADDTKYMARFEREAQVLASLNHPNIATVYGIQQGALVMELVEGSDLRGPLPLEEAIPIARQIAEGLEAAHERGIIHRDLKPANIKLTPVGVVKILDFGLAKDAGERGVPAPGSSPTMLPTLSLAMTQAGMILGTAAYMSPEQARGKPVDRRADIWAFGAVFYEMLTGARLFGVGETIAETLASVVKDAPDFGKLPADTPPHIRRLLERCLRKDVKTRLQAIGEARVLLDESCDAVAPAMPAVRRPWPAWTLAGVCALLALVLGGLLWRATRPTEKPLLRFSADLGPEAVAGMHITAAISPDGTRIVYPVQPDGGKVSMLATRLMDQTEPTILPGTEGGATPFFSPDGQWIGFFADRHLRKVPVEGGMPTTLCDVESIRGADWGEDGNIVVGFNAARPLARVSSGGGTLQSIGSTPEGGPSCRWPQFLPGGQAILFTASTAGSFDEASIAALDLKTGKTKVLHRGGYFGRYLPSGHLVFIRNGALFAVPFDLSRLETRGTAVPILEDIAGNPLTGGGQLAFSRTGTLVYLSGKPGASVSLGQLSWLDALGKREPLITVPSVLGPRLSPDGRRLTFFGTIDISVYDLDRGSLMRLNLSNNGTAQYPVWTPDGKHIVYKSPTGISWARSDGSSPPQLIYESSTTPAPWSFSPDGRHLAFHQAGAGTVRDLWTLPLDISDPDHPKAGPPEVFLASRGNDIEPAFSRDGRWLAYSSNITGAYQIFVRPFPKAATAGGQTQISTSPGRYPLWSRTANELFYLSLDGYIMVVSYKVNGSTFEASKPRQWVASRIILSGSNPMPYDQSADGKRFAVFLPAENSGPSEKANLHMTFLVNFFDELKRRVPPGAR